MGQLRNSGYSTPKNKTLTPLHQALTPVADSKTSPLAYGPATAWESMRGALLDLAKNGSEIDTFQGGERRPRRIHERGKDVGGRDKVHRGQILVLKMGLVRA